MIPRPAAVALLLALPGAGCAGVNWSSIRIDRPPESAAVEALRPGDSTLDDCLRILGAPNEVLENENGGGWLMTWSWTRGRGWGAYVSVPISEVANASLNWADNALSKRRLQLLFDSEQVLVDLALDQGQ